MANKIFVNIPVQDLERSKQFYTALGFTINPQFSDDTAACVVISEEIYAMILTHTKYKMFTTKEIADAHKTSAVLLALSFDSREEVNEMVGRALSAGATVASDPQDHGFMFSRSFNDPDGHTWEFFWMDVSQVPPAT